MPHRPPACAKWQSQSRRGFPHEPFIRLARPAAQLVIKMRDMQLPTEPWSEAVQQMQQNHRIEPARNRDGNSLAPAEQLPRADGLLNMFGQVHHRAIVSVGRKPEQGDTNSHPSKARSRPGVISTRSLRCPLSGPSSVRRHLAVRNTRRTRSPRAHFCASCGKTGSESKSATKLRSGCPRSISARNGSRCGSTKHFELDSQFSSGFFHFPR